MHWKPQTVSPLRPPANERRRVPAAPEQDQSKHSTKNSQKGYKRWVGGWSAIFFILFFFFRDFFFPDFHLLEVICIVDSILKKYRFFYFFIEGWGFFVFRSMIFRVLLKFDNCEVIMDHRCVGRVILLWMAFCLNNG